MQLFRFSYKNQAFIKVIIGFKRHFTIFVFGKVHDSATGLRRSSHFYVLKEKHYNVILAGEFTSKL
ncbi:hypothetical protein [Methanococcus voltae]|uniref:hypothetical protein n=1 Tax=Methanococcus voltae TaxID=2188 RepID=UPI0012F66437|nr:hypothetical protein [Methanococcus voltae]MCS3901762.1 hypothetical protein [Methanococcus voltae]